MRGSHGVGRIRDKARSSRSTPTDAEQRLWSRLRSRQVDGFKFVRQCAIGPYFADFVCREAMLVVEVDGGQHAESASDGRRTRYLTDAGYAVLRFWNNEVLGNTDGVVRALWLTLQSGPSPDLRFAPATLSPEGRRQRGADAATTRQRCRITADLPRLLKD